MWPIYHWSRGLLFIEVIQGLFSSLFQKKRGFLKGSCIVDTQMPRVTHVTSHNSLTGTSHMTPTTTNGPASVSNMCLKGWEPERIWKSTEYQQLPQRKSSEFGNSFYLLAPEILKNRCWMSRGRSRARPIGLRGFGGWKLEGEDPMQKQRATVRKAKIRGRSICNFAHISFV